MIRLIGAAGKAKFASAIAVLLAAASLRAEEISLVFHPEWAGRPLSLGTDHPTARGQLVRVTRVSALLSGFALARADGSTLLLPGTFAWIDASSGRMEALLSGVPEGDYRGISFDVGLPASADAADPSKWPAGHPLNPLVDGLYWGWRGGYVFFALEGLWSDAPGAAGGPTVCRGFSYHLAKDAGPMRAALPVPFRVTGATRLTLAIDFAGLLRPLHFQADGEGSSTHSRLGDALAVRLARALPLAIGWRGAAAFPAAALAPKPAAAAPSAVASGGPEAFPFAVPAGFPQPSLPADNLPTRPGVALGEILFNDRRLSGNGRQSCSACHDPKKAFASSEAVNLGADGKPGVRNSPSLLNLAWSPAYAWDGSKPRIRDQALAAMTSPLEMHASAGEVERRIGADLAMRARFQAAFGTPEITADRIGRALEQYLLTLVSADSKFDRAARGAAQLTAEEKRGFELFLTEYDPARGLHGADCFHCHGGALFTDFAYRDNGLALGPADAGRADVTHSPTDGGKFKTPSLRNVAVTGPYMHDGRFATLAEVVDHYVKGVRRNANLDPNLAKHPDSGLDLSPADEKALVAFLGILTDYRYLPRRTARQPPD